MCYLRGSRIQQRGDEREKKRAITRKAVRKKNKQRQSRSFTAISVSSGDDLVDLRLLENTILFYSILI